MPDTIKPLEARGAADSPPPEVTTPWWIRRVLRDSALALVVLAAVLGGVVGVVVAFLHTVVQLIQELAFDLPSGAHLGRTAPMSALLVVLAPTIGGFLLGWLTILGRRIRATDIVDPVEANALFGGKMSLFDSLRLTIATLVSNGAGASVGMEAAYTQMGAGLVSAIGQWLNLRRGDLRTLVGCGAAAAIAAAYSAPLAGAFYAFELVLGGYMLIRLAPVGAAAGVAVAVSSWLAGPTLIIITGPPVNINGWDYLAYGVVGLLSGGISIVTMQLVTASERLFRALPVPVWGRTALGGLSVGVLALWFPAVLGGGMGSYRPDLGVGVVGLLSLLLAKILASALSLGSGFRGGLFSASLLLGGLFGGVLGLLAEAFAPGLGLDAMALVLVGMGSIAAGIVGGPVTMVLLVLEVTSDVWAAAGVLIGVVVSTTVVRQAFGYSFTTWRFHQRGVSIRGAQDVGWMGDMRAGRLMRRDVKTMRDDLTLAELRRLHPLGSAKTVFAVDEAGNYTGVVDMTAVHDPALDSTLEGRVLREMAHHRESFLLLGDDIRAILGCFRDSEAEVLPVVATTGDRRILGYLTEAFALRRYSQELERLRSEAMGDTGLYGRD